MDEQAKSPADDPQYAVLAQALRAIRLQRRMRASEVARAMDMPLRTYEHFEAGRGRITYERIVRFSKATDSDPIALLSVFPLGSPEFAMRCADNKFMAIMMMAMSELNEELGDDVVYLEPRTIIGGFTRVCKEFVDHVRKRDAFAEAWLSENSRRIDGAPALVHPLLKPRRT